jgi:hypothetical protein
MTLQFTLDQIREISNNYYEIVKYIKNDFIEKIASMDDYYKPLIYYKTKRDGYNKYDHDYYVNVTDLYSAFEIKVKIYDNRGCDNGKSYILPTYLLVCNDNELNEKILKIKTERIEREIISKNKKEEYEAYLKLKKQFEPLGV